ncbi:MAG: DUF4340 domain-containing protein [Sulfuricaulis sp.]
MPLPPDNPKTIAPESPNDGRARGFGLKRRWLLNAGLLALIALLAWAATHRAAQQKIVSAPPLTALSATAVSHLRIERPGQLTVALEKTGDQWKLTAPVPARANAYNVNSLLRTLSAPAKTRFPAQPADLAKFGLDKPQSRVWFENDEIDFGAMHPLENQIYVRYKKEVALIPGYHLAAAIYPYTNFIDSHLFEPGRKLTGIELPGFTLSLKDGVWQRKPEDKKLSSDEINDFASEWQNASALTIDKYSGKKAVARIRIDSTLDGKNEKLLLDILSYKPDFVLHRPDENLEYHFTEDTGKRLLNLTGSEK